MSFLGSLTPIPGAPAPPLAWMMPPCMIRDVPSLPIPGAPAPPSAWMMPPSMIRDPPSPPIPAPPGVLPSPFAPMAVREPPPRKEIEDSTSIPAVPDEPFETNRFVPSIMIEKLTLLFIFRGTPSLSIFRSSIVTTRRPRDSISIPQSVRLPSPVMVTLSLLLMESTLLS